MNLLSFPFLGLHFSLNPYFLLLGSISRNSHGLRPSGTTHLSSFKLRTLRWRSHCCHHWYSSYFEINETFLIFINSLIFSPSLKKKNFKLFFIDFSISVPLFSYPSPIKPFAIKTVMKLYLVVISIPFTIFKKLYHYFCITICNSTKNEEKD